MRALTAVVDYLVRFLAVVAGAAMLFVMASLGLDVAMRKTVGFGIPQLIEYSEVLLVVMVFLAWAETQRRGSHVAIDLVFRRWSPRVQRIVTIVGTVIIIAWITPVVFEAGAQAISSYQRGEFRVGLSRTPIWPARASIAIGLGVLVLHLSLQVVRDVVLALRRGEPDPALDGTADTDSTPML